uniref:Leucine rich adaptor protein 1-like n=6 Tax=Passeriformes TaxID=9126 RepID=A0A8D2N3C0_ZONAL
MTILPHALLLRPAGLHPSPPFLLLGRLLSHSVSPTLPLSPSWGGKCLPDVSWGCSSTLPSLRAFSPPSLSRPRAYRMAAPPPPSSSGWTGEGDLTSSPRRPKRASQGRSSVNLRATDVKLMRQLLLINESIESIKWMIEEKAIASRGSSLSGSLCSLLESQETSLHGSCNSLQDCSDGLDGISVGSYLDTLVDDVPGHQTPSDLDKFSDSSVTEDSQSLHKHPKIDSDEYYCFG